jgi:hypothetical protein
MNTDLGHPARPGGAAAAPVSRRWVVAVAAAHAPSMASRRRSRSHVSCLPRRDATRAAPLAA